MTTSCRACSSKSSTCPRLRASSGSGTEPPPARRGACCRRSSPCWRSSRRSLFSCTGTPTRRSRALEDHSLTPGEYLLVTAHRAGNVDDPARLLKLVELLEALPLPTVFPLHPRTRARLEAAGLLERVAACPGLRLVPPLGYL